MGLIALSCCVFIFHFFHRCAAPSGLTFKWVSIQHKCDHLYRIQRGPMLRWLLLGAVRRLSNRGEKPGKILSIYIFLWLIFMQIRASLCSHLTWIIRIIKDKLSITYLKNRLWATLQLCGKCWERGMNFSNRMGRAKKMLFMYTMP